MAPENFMPDVDGTKIGAENRCRFPAPVNGVDLWRRFLERVSWALDHEWRGRSNRTGSQNCSHCKLSKAEFSMTIYGVFLLSSQDHSCTVNIQYRTSSRRYPTIARLSVSTAWCRDVRPVWPSPLLTSEWPNVTRSLTQLKWPPRTANCKAVKPTTDMT